MTNSAPEPPNSPGAGASDAPSWSDISASAASWWGHAYSLYFEFARSLLSAQTGLYQCCVDAARRWRPDALTGDLLQSEMIFAEAQAERLAAAIADTRADLSGEEKQTRPIPLPE